MATEEDIRQRFAGPFEMAAVSPGGAFLKQTWYRMIRKPA